MGIFDKISFAQPNAGGQWFAAGIYPVVRIIEVKATKSRKGEDLFIVECEIVESRVPTLGPGQRASWVVKLTLDSALGDVRAFICAAIGDDWSNPEKLARVGTEVAEWAVNPQQRPLVGRLLALEVVEKKTKMGNDFSKHIWRPGQAPMFA